MFRRWNDKERLDALHRSPFAQLWYSGSHEFPLVDIHDTPEAVQLLVDLPGMKQEDVKVETGDKYLSISGTRSLDDQLDHQERWAGGFDRRFSLSGKKLDLAAITAKMEAGVLTVTVPKQPETLPRKIEIE